MKPTTDLAQENTKKLKINPKELDEIREDFAKRLTALGLEHVATRRKDRPHVLARVNQGLERLEERQGIFEKAMESASPSFDAFAHRKAIAQAVARMREQAKKETKILDLKRAPPLDALKNFEKALTLKGVDVDKEVAATARKLGKDAARFLKLIGSAAKSNNLPRLWNLLARRLRSNPEYVELFKEAYGEIQEPGDITMVHAATLSPPSKPRASGPTTAPLTAIYAATPKP